MDLQLNGKIALVTGSTAGIGLAIAKRLVAEGATVVICGRNQQKLDAAIGETGARGVLADPATADGAAALVAAVPDVDILINNLGIYESKPFEEISDEDWRRFFEVNVLSGARLARSYFPGMIARDWGRVIFVASESGLLVPPDMVHYGMTKTAQLAIARGLAANTRGTRVTVNSVLPGTTRSEGIVDFLRSVADDPNAPEDQGSRIDQLKIVDAVLRQHELIDRKLLTVLGRIDLGCPGVAAEGHDLLFGKPFGRFHADPGLDFEERLVVLADQLEPSGIEEHHVTLAQRDAFLLQHRLDVGDGELGAGRNDRLTVISDHVEHDTSRHHGRHLLKSQFGDALDGDEISGFVAVVVGVVDADVADTIELRADSRPSVDQLVVECEFVRSLGRAAGFAGLNIVEMKAAVTKRREVLVDRNAQRVGLSGLDQPDGFKRHV
ncbi:hypothetical protein CWS35_29070 [Bradyrhizobium sp. SK17]|nr:hypothetical protein CWS35_29070 [Bradyrhizobium sp. SK17]